jgi:hypothetical protein
MGANTDLYQNHNKNFRKKLQKQLNIRSIARSIGG